MDFISSNFGYLNNRSPD